jgi:hypothetical protein
VRQQRLLDRRIIHYARPSTLPPRTRNPFISAVIRAAAIASERNGMCRLLRVMSNLIAEYFLARAVEFRYREARRLSVVYLL